MKLRFLSFILLSSFNMVCGSSLKDAIDAHDFSLVKELVEQGADVNEKYKATHYGNSWKAWKSITALGHACANIMCECNNCLEENEEYFENQLNIIEFLIQAGATISFDIVASCFENHKQNNYVVDTWIDLKQSWILQSIVSPKIFEATSYARTTTGLVTADAREAMYKAMMKGKTLFAIVQKGCECATHIKANALPLLNAQTRIFYLMTLFVKYGFDINACDPKTGDTLLDKALQRYMLPDFVIVLLALGVEGADTALYPFRFPLSSQDKKIYMIKGGPESAWQNNMLSIAFIAGKKYEPSLSKVTSPIITERINQNIIYYTMLYYKFFMWLFGGAPYVPFPGYPVPSHRGK